MVAQEAALKEVAISKLRRSLAYNKSVKRADVQIGGATLSHKAMNREGAPRRRGPAKILDIGEIHGTAKMQSQTSKAARYCVRKRGGEMDDGELEWDPPQVQPRTTEVAPWERSLQRGAGNEMEGEEDF